VYDIKKDERVQYYEVYTDTEIITYKKVEKEKSAAAGVANLSAQGSAQGESDLQEVLPRVQHYFKDVPVVQYPNNEELIGDFEGVITLIDAYNIAQSDTANDFEYFTDAYMVLKGYGGLLDEEEDAHIGELDAEGNPLNPSSTLNQPQLTTVQKMKENRILLLDEGGDASWLIKDINDVATENFKNRLREDIHTFSKVPNMADDQFGGNASGVAISYKLSALEHMVSIKERKFKRALQRRIELITNILNAKGKNYDWRDINITFTRNVPQNLQELATLVGTLRDLVSDETLLSLLPFVTNVQDEMAKLEEQNEGAVDLDEVDDGGDGDEGVNDVGQDAAGDGNNGNGVNSNVIDGANTNPTNPTANRDSGVAQ